MTIVDCKKLAENASAAIQDALDNDREVYVPDIGAPLVLDRPIVLDSFRHLKFAETAVIRMKSGCGGCMLRSRRLADGRYGPIPAFGRDTDMSMEGGIWEDSAREPSPNDPDPLMRDFSKNILGVLFFCHCDHVSVRNLTLRRGEQYGLLMTDCYDFTVENLFFDDYRKDGVHVNGPAARGLIQDLRGRCGDDFVALNAWDWCTSAVSFGAISDILVRRLSCTKDEIRLLPGRKTYENGRQTDCPVSDCVFEDIENVYCFKLYQQPNCHNKEWHLNDMSDIPGRVSRVLFRNVRLSALTETGFGTIHPDALFEMGADCEDVTVENLNAEVSARDFEKAGMTVSDIGPKSATWKRGDDPENWCELFQPDLVCRADRITFRNIRLGGVPFRDKALLTKEKHLTLNPDYPATTPQGGTGYGILGEVTIE